MTRIVAVLAVWVATSSVVVAESFVETFDTGIDGFQARGVSPGSRWLGSTIGPDGSTGVAEAARIDGDVFSVTLEAGDFIDPTNPILGDWTGRFADPVTGLVTVRFWLRDVDGQVGGEGAFSMWVGDRFQGLNRYFFSGGPTAAQPSPLADPGWAKYAVTFSTQWDVATATANGWTNWTPGVMGNVNRFGIFGNGQVAPGGDVIWVDDIEVVPEPATLALLAALGLFATSRRR